MHSLVVDRRDAFCRLCWAFGVSFWRGCFTLEGWTNPSRLTTFEGRWLHAGGERIFLPDPSFFDMCEYKNGPWKRIVLMKMILWMSLVKKGETKKGWCSAIVMKKERKYKETKMYHWGWHPKVSHRCWRCSLWWELRVYLWLPFQPCGGCIRRGGSGSEQTWSALRTRVAIALP